MKLTKIVSYYLLALLILFLVLSIATGNWKFFIFSIVPIALAFAALTAVSRKNGPISTK
ncbi:hypothetical protein QT716_14245 [Sporosarcina aquimarina]|uniref:Uncharacterized protein n=1 Tax=Sporosarcina aquimarina TaxID=114975 RepID=A0ABU4G2I8_9BACL|nr:hypothetical protein [Sporosarcina aquimarina]